MNPTAVAIFIGLLLPSLCVGQPSGAAAYRLGEPIYLEFQYDGSIEGWDGEIAAGDRHGEPGLTISNGAFFVLTKGRQEFVPGEPDSNNFIPKWKTHSALHGELVQPVGERVSRPWFNVALVKPFRTVLDITEFFQIDSPGTYNVYWGMKKLWSEEITFVVLPADAGTSFEREQ
jgi:hypothetical protein